MKYFCYLFSLYFLVLSAMPCTDIHNLNTSVRDEYASIFTDNHSNCPHEAEPDFCSPFCVCSCCGQLFVAIQLPIPEFRFQLRMIRNSKEKNDFLFAQYWQNHDLKSIFRPPQLG